MEGDVGERIRSFRDLRVYSRALDLQREVFEITKTFPKTETYSLTDQIRRSARSVGANIAEAWQKRRYPLHFVSKLSDSDGEQAETQHWIQTSFECEYLSEKKCSDLLEICKEIGRMLGTMMENPEPFCRRLAK
jgi:four helix bundle protein